MNAIEILQGLLTPVIGLTTLYIAYQQHQIEKAKFRHERYERRLRLFKAAMQFVACATTAADLTNEELHSFLRETSEARFLFGKEVEKFIDTLYKKGVDLHHLNKKIEASRGPQSEADRAHLADELKELLLWFGNQFEEGRRLFDPYLSLREK